MTEEMTDTFFLAEGANPDTPPERLTELAAQPALQMVIAANPGTPETTLEMLSQEKNPAIRARLAQNPNTPLPILINLAQEFPHEFLANPVLALLNLASPDFLKQFPPSTWFQLLRCQELPKAWLQWLSPEQKDSRRGSVLYRASADIESARQKHVALLNKVPRDWRATALREVKQFQEHLPPTPSPTSFPVLLIWPELILRNILRLQAEEQATIVKHCPTLKSETLHALFRNQLERDFSLQRSLARHPNTPVEVLTKLSHTKRDPLVRKAVACNPRTPPFLLSALAQDSNAMVCRAVALHPATPLADLTFLAHSPETEVRAALAGNAKLDEELFWHLADDSAPEVRARLARQRGLPAGLLEVLANDAVTAVRVNAARNLSLSEEILTLLLKDTEIEVLCALAGNSQLLQTRLWQLSEHPSAQVRERVAGNPRAPLALLEKLMEQGDQDAQRGLARNPHATPAMLAKLAMTGDTTLHMLLLKQKHTPVETLMEIVGQYQPNLSRAMVFQLVSNPHTPLILLNQILENGHYDLLPGIANHPAVRRNRRQIVKDYLSKNVGWDCVHKNVLPFDFILLADADLPADLLLPFTRASAWEVRFLAVQHPTISLSLLEELSNDANQFVRTAAREALAERLPRKLFRKLAKRAILNE